METKSVLIKTRKEWRDWLKKNHQKETKVNLISYKKHTGVPSISHRESLEEAICFGWVDTTLKKLDEDRFQRTFVKRNKNSRWSNNTLSYAKDMITQKKMSPYGLKMYEEGLKKGVIDHGIPKDAKAPEDLIKKLSKSKKALNFFNGFPPSRKRMYIIWVLTAKREETRNNRIDKIYEFCKEEKKIW